MVLGKLTRHEPQQMPFRRHTRNHGRCASLSAFRAADGRRIRIGTRSDRQQGVWDLLLARLHILSWPKS
jgi:hypothetical protein